MAGWRTSGEFAVAFSKPEPQVSYLRELLPETTACQLRRVAVRRARVRRHGPECEVVSWLRRAAAGKTGGFAGPVVPLRIADRSEVCRPLRARW